MSRRPTRAARDSRGPPCSPIGRQRRWAQIRSRLVGAAIVKNTKGPSRYDRDGPFAFSDRPFQIDQKISFKPSWIERGPPDPSTGFEPAWSGVARTYPYPDEDAAVGSSVAAF